jgi:hypothetical protein
MGIRDTILEMAKKRLIVDLDEVEHAGLVKSARAVDMTVSNFVRKALGLPLLKQGVKRPESKKKAAAKSAEVRKKKATKRKAVS